MLRAITFDGGGIRGLISVILLQRLLSGRRNLLDRAMLLSGTSTGGFIALALADEYPIDRIRQLYEFRGKDLFVRNWKTPLGLFGAKYKNTGLAAQLHALFQDRPLGTLNHKVLIPAFALCTHTNGMRDWGAKFFSNWSPSDPDCRVPIKDVAMATGAAPTYFPAHNGYVDGGMVANNPCSAAMAFLMNPEVTRQDVAPNRVHILSIGTGNACRYIRQKDANWGLVQWGGKLVDIFMDGLDDVPVYHCQAILRNNFFRIQPLLDPEQLPALDEYGRVKELIAIAENYDLGPAELWLDHHW